MAQGLSTNETLPQCDGKTPSSAFRTQILAGAAVWVVFCIVAVLVRGVRWDETFEHAQVIARAVPYPEGHPLFRYCRAAFSLQTYFSALLLWLGIGPALLCGFRNVLALMATCMPVFLLTSLWSRRPVWGHAAVLLALQGIYLEFDGSYPLTVWPTIFSNGVIGGGYALITLFLLAAGKKRAAFFLTGFMPCIHVGQWPPVLGLAVLCAIFQYRNPRQTLRDAVFPFVFGIALCVVFLLIVKSFNVPPPIAGPYASSADPWPIWRAYTARDGHRQFPPGNGHLAVAGMLLLGIAAAYSTWRDNRQEPHAAILPINAFLYTAIIAATVWGIMAAHATLGTAIPYALIGWMPYRLINHVAPILLSAMVGILASRDHKAIPFWSAAATTPLWLGSRARPILSQSGVVAAALHMDVHKDPATHIGNTRTAPELIILGALAYALICPWLSWIVGAHTFSRYFAAGDAVFFGLYGAASATMLAELRDDRRALRIAAAIGFAAFVALAAYHHFGAVCLACGFIVAWILRCTPATAPKWNRRAAGALCCVLGSTLLYQQWTTREHLPVRPFDQRLAEYLREQHEPDAMLVAHPTEFLLQAKTGHPMLVETATASLMSYMPALAPAIDKIYTGLYGIRLQQPAVGAVLEKLPLLTDSQGSTPFAPSETVPWQELWANRTPAQWHALGTEYDFHYVVAPHPLELRLPLVFRDDAASFYRIPN